MTENPRAGLDAIVRQLRQFDLNTSDPRWSSYVLDGFLDETLRSSDQGVLEIFQGLTTVLKVDAVALTSPVAAFIRDVVVRCFTHCQQSYESSEWQQVVDNLDDKATPAQLYLALHAIPPQFVTPRLASIIATGLESTAFRDEALGAMAA